MVFGPGSYGMYMLGSDDPIAFDPDAIRTVLGRPGILAEISTAYDSPTNDDRRLDGPDRRRHVAVGDGRDGLRGDRPDGHR